MAQAVSPSARFVENRGQIVDAEKHLRPDILYGLHARGVNVYLRTSGLSYVFVRSEHDSSGRMVDRGPFACTRPDTGLRVTRYRMDMDLAGANPHARVTSDSASGDYTNYYLAHCPQGITNVHAYARVTYHDIYPHIDLVYYGSGGGMKYDFVVHPGGRVSDIVMRYVGASELRGTEAGTVRVTNPLGAIEEGHPEIYQSSGGARHRVSGTYATGEGAIRFNVGTYDGARDLVIDPTLGWSTYVGGHGTEFTWYDGGWGGWGGYWSDGGTTCRSDRDSSFTAVAASESTDFPTTPGVVQQNKGAATDFDVVAFRFSNCGVRMWATYFGGTHDDWVADMAIDRQRNCLIFGNTQSTDLPVPAGAFNPTYTGTTSGFIVKLDDAGHQAWSTYYNTVAVKCGAVDSLGNLVIGGFADRNFVATPGAFQTVAPPVAAMTKGFLARFNSAGTRRWATLFGATPVNTNSNRDGVMAVAMDSAGTIYACGTTSYTDFPIVGTSYQPANSGSFDAWLARIDTSGMPVWSTYYGGGADESATAIALDSRQGPVMVGETTSQNFPVSANAFQPVLNIGITINDCFVVKFDRDGNRQWATYYGGSGFEGAPVVDVNSSDDVWMGVSTYSRNFPITNDAYQAASAGDFDCAIVKFNSSGLRLWASYFGGTDAEILNSIVASGSGFVVTGTTTSTNLPLVGLPFQSSNHGGTDMFLAYFCDPLPPVSVDTQRVRICQGDSVVLTGPAGYIQYVWSNGATNRTTTVNGAGAYTVTGMNGACGQATGTIVVTVLPLPVRYIVPAGPILLCSDSVLLHLNQPVRSYRWSTGDTTAAIMVKTTGRYTVSFTDSNGCSNHSDTLDVQASVRPTVTITPQGPLAFCDGGSVVLDATSTGVTYAWSNGATTPRITVDKFGTYTVRVTNADGCSASASATVRVFPNPTLAIRNLLPTTFCEGDSTILVAKASTTGSYLWSDGTTGPLLTVRKEGSFTVTFTDTNGCSVTSRIATSVKPGPRAAISASGPTRFCAGDSVVLSVSGFVEYQWSNGSTGPSTVAKLPGKYFATVVSDGGCVGSSDTVTVEVLPLPVVAISGPSRVCNNALASYTVAAAPGTTFEWSVAGNGSIASGQGSNTIGVQWGASGGGTLYVKVTSDASGCTADTSFAVTIGSSLKPAVT
ncbi:MAG: hypothetical protein JST22_21440, partial [Bacteroidetes bacterium]|nr:hypothetical protein [Bacteroidota bacterium]